MAQYVFTMNRVGKIVPPKRQILKDISLSFFPGANRRAREPCVALTREFLGAAAQSFPMRYEPGAP